MADNDCNEMVAGDVPAAWYLEMRAERDRLLKRLAVAEAYIPSGDFSDYQADANAVGGEMTLREERR